MWAPGLLLGIAALAAVALVFLYSGLFVVGAPLFVIGVIVIGALDFQRRRRHVAS